MVYYMVFHMGSSNNMSSPLRVSPRRWFVSCEVLTGEAKGATTGADHGGGRAAFLAPFLEKGAGGTGNIMGKHGKNHGTIMGRW